MARSPADVAVYPGTFDPFTNGHLDVIRRARDVFGQVIVAVGPNPAKMVHFAVPERIKMIQESVRRLSGVEVTSFEGLVVDYVRSRKCRVILRGIRTLSDYEFEFQMALTNRSIAKNIETVFIMAAQEYSYISSHLVKEIASLGGDVTPFVPPPVLKWIRRKFSERR